MAMKYHCIHLWGDSLGKGVVFDEARGRYCITPDRCVLALEKALGVPIHNHSRMGATLLEGLADFQAMPADPGALAVIEYGGNDCDMPWKEISEQPDEDYRGKIPLPDFTKAMHDFLRLAREREMLPVLVTPPPLEAQRYFNWVTKGLSQANILHFLGDVQHIYRWQERYATAVRDVAHETRTPLYDMRGAFLEHRRYPSLFCADGIHPNAQGHAVIAQAVIDQRDALAAQIEGARRNVPPVV